MPDKENGIQAIIALQKLARIDKPIEKATINWDAFSDYEKKTQLRY